MASGGIVDDAADVIPVNLLNARLTPGPIEWDAWASLSLDTWGVSTNSQSHKSPPPLILGRWTRKDML